MTPSKETSKQTAEYYSAQYRAICWERPSDSHGAKGQLYRAIKAVAKSGLAFGFSESDVRQRLAWFGIGSRRSLTMLEAHEVTRDALRAAFSEWRALPE